MKKNNLLPLLIFIGNLVFHLWNINQDLPFLYNMDEPHHLHVAAYFSTGDLNPHDFKYPTFWPYVVALLLGTLYTAGRFLGIVHSSHEFAVHFFADPTPFYLFVRGASAIFLSLAPMILFLGIRRTKPNINAVAVALFASFSPLVTEYGRDGTHYSMLFFLLSVCLYFFLRVSEEPALKYYLLSGLFMGLATSTYYLAAPVGLALIILHFQLPKEIRKSKWLGAFFITSGGAFLLASPYILLDFKTFLGTFSSLQNIQNTETSSFNLAQNTLLILKNAVTFIDGWGIGFSLAILGLIFCSRQDKLRNVAFIFPLLLFLPYLAKSYYGAVERYAYCVQFPLYLLAADGFASLWNKIPRKFPRLIFFMAVFLPSAAWSLSYPWRLGLPDTRTLARRWIDENISSGSSFLLFAQYHSVPLPLLPEQLDELLEQAKQVSVPKLRYYRLLKESHRGKGYRVYYVKRSDNEVQDLPERTEKSMQVLPLLDPDALGLEGLRKTGVQYIILDQQFRYHRQETQWMKKLESFKPIYEIYPEAGRRNGPPVQIYKIS